jgi:MOSC domain-containing protein YiiM
MGLMERPAHVLSANVGLPRTVTWGGRAVTSAIWKSPVPGRIPVEGVNFAGDDQADRRVHGGPDKAVYAYAIEDYAWWGAELGTALDAGTFGENLTTEGIDLHACVVGQRWNVGTAVLEVAQPRSPCFKLGMRMGDAHFVDRFDESGRLGTYLRIVGDGEIGAGDAIVFGDAPTHGITIADLVRAQREPTVEMLRRVAAVDAVPEGWRDWARRQLRRSEERRTRR